MRICARIAALLVLLLAASPVRAAAPPPFETETYAALKASHAGRPFILHFWGLSCTPCLAELPRWGELVHDYPSLGLVLIAADPFREDPARIETTLGKAGLGEVESYAFAEDFVERLRYSVDPKWRGELPRTVLVARDGTAVTISGTAEPGRLRAWAAEQGVPRRK